MTTFMKQSNPVQLEIRCAFILRGVMLFYGFLPRKIQLINLLLLIKKQDDKGRLLQINTGEGKTLIIAMLAVFKFLENIKVDIVTSSTDLGFGL